MLIKKKRKCCVSKRSVVYGDVFEGINDAGNDAGEEDCESLYILRVSVDQVVVAMRHPTSLYFRGVIEAKAIAGSFETTGYQINDDDNRSYTLFSLEDSSANYIATVRNATMTGHYLNLLFQLGLTEDVIYKMINYVGCTGCVVLLNNAVDRFHRWNEFLASIDINIFPSRKKKGFSLFPDAEDALGAILDEAGGTRIEKKLVFCKDWDVIMSAFPTDQHFKVMFCGGKGVGKSTTMRYMINRCLQLSPKVLVIDLDIGQSEFTICGSVSAVVVYTPLLGPNFTHLKNPSRSYFIGSVDVTQCLSDYLNAVRSLFDYCLYNPQFSNCTWFINTMGITKGIGLDLLATLIKLMLPDFVLQIQSNDCQLNFENQLQPHNISKYGLPKDIKDIKQYTLFTARSSVLSSHMNTKKSNLSILTPKALREIVMLIYLTKASLDDNRRLNYLKYIKIKDNCEETTLNNINCGYWQLVALSKPSNEINPIILGYGLAKEYTENGKRYMLILSPVQQKTWCDVKTVYFGQGLSLSKTLITLVTRVFDTYGFVPGMIVSNFIDHDGNEIAIKKQLFYE